MDRASTPFTSLGLGVQGTNPLEPPADMLRIAIARAIPKSTISVNGSRAIVPHTLRLSHTTPLVRYNASKSTPAASSEPGKAKFSHNPDWSVPIVTYEDIKALVRNPVPGTYLIDVREKDETAQGMIPTALNIPLSSFMDCMRAPADTFHEIYGVSKPRPDQNIIFYCRSGKRSATAADAAKDNGFKNVKSYEGSWLDWVKKTQEKDYNL